jgi:hypothetical protein
MAGYKKKLPMSAAMRPGTSGGVPPPKAKSEKLGGFDLGSLKGPSKGPMTSTGAKPPARIGKGVSTPGMKPPKMPKFKGMK